MAGDRHRVRRLATGDVSSHESCGRWWFSLSPCWCRTCGSTDPNDHQTSRLVSYHAIKCIVFICADYPYYRVITADIDAGDGTSDNTSLLGYVHTIVSKISFRFGSHKRGLEVC